MRYFPLLDFQSIVVAFCLGLTLVIVAYIAWTTYSGRGEEKESELFEVESHEETRNPIPPLLIFVYIGIAIWVVAYVILIGIRGGAIG